MTTPFLLFPLLHCVCTALPSGGAVTVRSEDVRYPSGELQLAAELLVPEFGGPFPAAVLIQGSGASDRSNEWAASIAHELTQLGVAVLLTDKRGCGGSQGDWLTADFDDLADDALAGLRYLTTRDEVDAERIGLLGLSQGGWVAPIAAARSPEVAFVITVSGAAVGFAEQVVHEMTNTARQAGLSEEGVELVLELGRAASRYALSGEWDAYARVRTEALASEARPIAAGFPDSPQHPRWVFLRGVGGFDPMPFWTIVEQPVFVVFGSEDERDNVPVAESVRRLERAFSPTRKHDVEIVVIPGVGHALLDAVAGGLAPDFVDALGTWIMETIEP